MNNSGSATSTIIARHDYLPFGKEIGAGIGLRTTTQKYSTTDRARQRYGLTERDETTGLDHTWFRKYESSAGWWTSPDPLPGNLGDPQSFNRYSYTTNDPINFVDPSGLMPCVPGDISLEKRIEQQDACGKFFGGKEKALKALDKLKAQMGNLPDRGIAAIDGNKVTLDSTRFINAGTPVSSMRLDRVEGAATVYATQTHYLSGALFSAFVVGHEFGHKMKSYDKKNDPDKGDSTKVGLNNEQLRAACFPELAAP